MARFDVVQFVRVARAAEIPPGEAKAFAVGDWEVAGFNVDGVFHGVQATCPHQGGPLAEGWMDGPVVTCPWHAWCFDVRNGHMILSDIARLATFEVQLEGDEVLVADKPAGW